MSQKETIAPPAPRAVPAPAAVLTHLFEVLEQAGVAYAVLGDARGLPEPGSGDVDLVVAPEAWPLLPGVLGACCQAHGLRLVQALPHEATGWAFTLAWPDGAGSLHLLQPDVCTDYRRRGRPLLPATTLLAGRRRHVAATGHTFYAVAPAPGFAYYLLKKLDKGDLTAAHGAYLSGLWRQDAAGAAALLARFFSASDLARLAHAAAHDAWQPVLADLAGWRRRLRGRLAYPLGARLHEARRLWHRVRHPAGLFVALLGPDGSGKSSVAARVEAALRPLFRRTYHGHFRPYFFGRDATPGQPVHDPQGRPPRRLPPAALKLAYYAADFGVGYALRLAPRRVQAALILFDRYFDDLLVDPARFRLPAAALPPARWLARRLPRPDVLVLLDVPAAVLQARKQEVPPAESARQRAAFKAHVATRAEGATVNAARPLPEVTAQVLDVLTRFLEARTARTLARTWKSS